MPQAAVLADRPALPRRGGRPVALATLCTLLFLTFLDNTVVSVALGDIQSQLHAGVSSLQWVVSAYALPFASMMLACGMIGDEFGRKRLILWGGGVFCGGSILCALAPASSVLIAGRAVMGLGAAASEPGTLSLLRHIYPEDRARSRAVGVWAAVSGLALALGPVVGGTLVGLWDWRAIFWFNLLFGFIALVVGAIVLPESADPQAHRVDIAGTLLGGGALAMLVYAIIDGESAGYRAPHVLALLCAALVAGAAFIWWERRAPHPLLDLRFLRIPAFSSANVAAFCTYFATFAVFFFTALYLEEVVGYSGYRIAGVFLPMTALMIIASLMAGRWTSGVDTRWSITVGCLVFGAGLLTMNTVLSPHPDQGELMAALALVGIGIGTTVVPITTAVLAAVPPERSGMAASATNTSREIGAVAGAAVLGSLVNAQLSSHLVGELRKLGIPATFQSIVINAIETGRIPAGGAGVNAQGHEALVQKVIAAAYSAFQAGLQTALWVSAALVLGSAALAVVTLGHHARPGDQSG